MVGRADDEPSHADARTVEDARTLLLMLLLMLVPLPSCGSQHEHEGDYSPTCNTARNASWGISTLPTCFMRFFPSFCFSRSLRLRVMSPP